MFHPRIRVIVLAICLALPLLAPVRRAQAAEVTTLAEAQQAYDDARFGDAVAGLRSMLQRGLVQGTEAEAARELLARSLVKSGNRIEAKEAFRGILSARPQYRPDPARVAPDEVEVFQLALREYTVAEIESGTRIPASFSFFVGYGKHNNGDLNRYAEETNGETDEGGIEIGGTVRFPLRERLSLELEYSSLKAEGTHPFSPTTIDVIETTGRPLVASLYWNWLGGPHGRTNLFIGAGQMRSVWSQTEGPSLNLTDEKIGVYAHGGIEGEYLFSPRIAASVRVLGRYATSGKLNFGFFGGTAGINNRQVDFRGIAVQLGLRGYVGY